MGSRAGGETWFDRVRGRWRGPRSFTAILPLGDGDPRAARRRIRGLEGALEAELAGVRDLHFLRLVAVPADARTGAGPRLLLNVVHDRPLDEHLADLTRRAGPILLAMLGDAAPSGRPLDLAPHLVAHRARDHTFYIGAVGLTVERIRAERALRDALEDRIDALEREGAFEGLSPEEARLALRRFAEAELTDARFARGPAPRPSAAARRLKLLDLALVFTLFPIIGVLGYDVMDAARRQRPGARRALTRVAAWGWWLWGAVPTAIAFLTVRALELTEPEHPAPWPAADELEDLEEAEDERPRNELTVWFPVRSAWISRALLRVILFGAERGTRHFWTDGRLAGAQNIHYARILQTDGGRSMIFMSDYEGSFDAYIDHFVGIGGNHRAVVPISSRLRECPKTRWLYLQADPPRFRTGWKRMIRAHQTQASVWYSAYPDLTCNDVLNNAAIRAGLFADALTDGEARAFLRRL